MRERRGWEGNDGENEVEVDEEDVGTFNLTISPCLRRGARLGKISPAASPADCAKDELESEKGDKPDIVGSLGGIIYLTGDAREGLVCLEGKVEAIISSSALLFINLSSTIIIITIMMKVVAIHVEEETNTSCPSPKAWCSDYGSK